nr:WG repeat-containing protein [Leptospira interrogans]
MRYLSTLIVMFCLLQCRPDDPRRQEIAGPDLLPGAYEVHLDDYKDVVLDHELFSEDRFPLWFQLIDKGGSVPGFIDHQGNVVIEPKFLKTQDQMWYFTHSYEPFNGGMSIVQSPTGGQFEKHCLKRIKEGVGKGNFDASVRFVYGCDSRTYDIIDNTGNVISKVPYFFLSGYSENLCASSSLLESKHGFIDRSGKIAIPEIYDHTWDFNDGLALVKLKGEMFFINKKGKKVFGNPYNPEDAYSFSNGMSVVRKGGNTKPLIILGAYIKDYWDGGLLGYIDTTGKVVIEPKFSKASSFSEGLAYVETPNGEKGYIDKTGNFKIQKIKNEDIYSARSFSDGFAYVEFISVDENRGGSVEETKRGFIDKTGKFVLDLTKETSEATSKYDAIGDFSEGLAVVYTKDPNRRMLFIDKTGKVAFDVNDINRKIWERFKKH